MKKIVSIILVLCCIISSVSAFASTTHFSSDIDFASIIVEKNLPNMRQGTLDCIALAAALMVDLQTYGSSDCNKVMIEALEKDTVYYRIKNVSGYGLVTKDFDLLFLGKKDSVSFGVSKCINFASAGAAASGYIDYGNMISVSGYEKCDLKFLKSALTSYEFNFSTTSGTSTISIKVKGRSGDVWLRDKNGASILCLSGEFTITGFDTLVGMFKVTYQGQKGYVKGTGLMWKKNASWVDVSVDELKKKCK